MNNHITVNDIVAVCTIINLAASRGAFRADELTEVGTVFDRLSQMVQAASNPQPTDSTESSPPGE